METHELYRVGLVAAAVPFANNNLWFHILHRTCYWDYISAQKSKPTRARANERCIKTSVRTVAYTQTRTCVKNQISQRARNCRQFGSDKGNMGAKLRVWDELPLLWETASVSEIANLLRPISGLHRTVAREQLGLQDRKLLQTERIPLIMGWQN